MRKTRAITLVEVLLVLVIIGLLWAILMPVVNSAVARGKETACKEKLKQLSHAIAMYRDEYGGADYYGEVTKMGMPPDLGDLMTAMQLPLQSIRCSGDPTTMGGSEAVSCECFPRQTSTLQNRLGPCTWESTERTQS